MEATDARRVDLLEKLGDVLALTAQRVEALACFEEKLKLISESDRVTHAQVYRKIAAVLNSQQDYEAAFKAHNQAQAVLGQPPEENDRVWWSVWLQNNIDRIGLCYFANRLDEAAALTEMVRTVIQYGTVEQRCSFYMNTAIANLRRSRYFMPPDSLLDDLDRSIEAGQSSKELSQFYFALFAKGFTHLWRNELDQAESIFADVIPKAKRIGDVTVLARLFTYMTVIQRKRGLVEATKQYALQSLTVARTASMPEYIAMAQANLVWVALREHNLNEAETIGDTTYQLFKSTAQAAMFPSLVIWPLIGIRLQQNKLAEIIEYARSLVVPTVQPLPLLIEEPLEQAIQAWEKGEITATRQKLEQAASFAYQFGYL